MKIILKTCPRCTQKLPASDFGQNARNVDGRATYCLACFRKIQEEFRRRKRQREGKPEPVRRVAPDGKKWCPDCREFLPTDAFSKNRASSNGLNTYCRGCAGIRIRESAERVHGGFRHYHLIRRYGIGAKEVEAMIERQSWTCPICLNALDARAHVDHDHETGRVRGVLCFNCNAGLGKYRDDPQILQRAIGYLNRCLPAPTYLKELGLIVESFDWMPEPLDVQKLPGLQAQERSAG